MGYDNKVGTTKNTRDAIPKARVLSVRREMQQFVRTLISIAVRISIHTRNAKGQAYVGRSEERL